MSSLHCGMKTSLGRWMLGYGIFLCVCGMVGFFAAPGLGKQLAASGTAFGGLSLIWAFLLERRRKPAWWGAVLTTAVLAVVFLSRATGAMALVEPSRVVAGLNAISFLGSIITVAILFRGRGEILSK